MLHFSRSALSGFDESIFLLAKVAYRDSKSRIAEIMFGNVWRWIGGQMFLSVISEASTFYIPVENTASAGAWNAAQDTMEGTNVLRQ